MAIRVHLMHTTDHHESMGTPAPGGAYFNSLLAEEADIPLQRGTLPGQSKTDIRIWNIHDGTSDTLVIMLPKGYSAVQDAEHMKHTGAERLLVMPTERAKEVNSTTLLPNNHIRLISYCIGIRCAKCELELPLHNFGDIAKVQMFFLTVILIILYGTMVWGMLGVESTWQTQAQVSLPAFSESMVVLLGISHLGYLAIKQTGD